MNRKKPNQLIEAQEVNHIDHMEIERAIKHVVKDGVIDFVRSDPMADGFKSSLNVERLQNKTLADTAWRENFHKALASDRVVKALERFADELAAEAMLHAGGGGGEK